jgi:hypothetical protein
LECRLLLEIPNSFLDMKLRTLAAVAAIACIPAVAAFGQTNFSATFTFGADGNVASFAYNGGTIPGVSLSDLTKVGVTTSSSSGNFRASVWPDGATTGSDAFTGSIDLGKYFEFSLTAASGYTIDLATIEFGIGRSGTGPRQWEWRTSADAYANALNSYSSVTSGLTNTAGVLTNPDTNSSWTGNVLGLSHSNFQNVTSITFRFYGYNSEAAAGTGGLQGPLTITGQAIPEPATYAAILGIAVLGGAALARRRQLRK